MSSMRSASSSTNLQIAKVDESALEEILEASGRCNNHACSATDRVQLISFGEAAYRDGCAGKFRSAQRFVLIGNLHGKFPSGNQDECRDARSLSLKQSFHHRDQESKRFAGACLRGCNHVLALKGWRKSCRLHWCWYGKFGYRQPLL